MQGDIVARNYAEVLLALASRADNRDGFGAMIRDLAAAISSDRTVRRFLESPRIPADRKVAVVSEALDDRVPRIFLRFVQSVLAHRRQNLIPAIALEYGALVDEIEGRVHAQVAVARPVEGDEARALVAGISRAIGKTVVPHYEVRPEMMGGVVVRIGDRVLDGSVRRRLQTLARRMRAQA